MAFGVPVSLLGFIVKGDLAGQTIYTDRHGRKVYFPQAPPNKPPSPLQVVQRARFAAALGNWKALSHQQKAAWEAITLKASLCMTGHNLFIHVSLRGDFSNLATLQAQTGIDVDDPEYIPWPPN